MRKLIVVLGAAVALALVAAPAGAQTYPTGSTSTTTGTPSSASINAGTLGSGGATSVDVCGFLAGSTVTVTVNGGSAFTLTVGSNGCVTITISVTSAGSAFGRPVFATVGMQLAQTGSTLVINGHTITGNPPGVSNTIVVSGTGSDGNPRTVSVVFTTSTSSSSALPRTGVMILRWTLAALALIGVGALLVLADRRRGRKSSDV